METPNKIYINQSNIPSAFEKVSPGNFQRLASTATTEFDQITQQKIAYYSDFELSVDEWRMEFDCVQLYAKTLHKALGTLC